MQTPITPHARTMEQQEIITEIEKLAELARQHQLSFVFGLQLSPDHNYLAMNTPSNCGASICSAILDLAQSA